MPYQQTLAQRWAERESFVGNAIRCREVVKCLSTTPKSEGTEEDSELGVELCMQHSVAEIRSGRPAAAAKEELEVGGDRGGDRRREKSAEAEEEVVGAGGPAAETEERPEWEAAAEDE